LVNLTDLQLGWNQIKNISALAHLIQIRIIDLHDNKITDISPLVENRGLGERDRVDLRQPAERGLSRRRSSAIDV
jgi:Leucine-rich repeat (LRR) protein